MSKKRSSAIPAGHITDHASIGLRAAQYVRMSTDKQQYSPLNQMAAIAAYAARRNLAIVRTYSDEGRSGLDIDGRTALQSLLWDVRNGRAGYEVILVYDVSRWGRFQDADESAYYEFVCKEAGIQVHYCAEEFENDGSLASTILKNMKRVMAGEYSRELSTKVFAAQCRGAGMGFWQGAPAGYGLRRQLLDERCAPKAVLENGQRKSLRTDRVILTPGPPSEIKIIQRIFTSFAMRGKTRTEIAAELNAERKFNARGRPWIMQTIDDILRNEKYIGHNVFNRASFKLQQKHVSNPADMWVRHDNAFRPIISQDLFVKAQKRLLEVKRGRRVPDKELLDRLTALWRRKGHLSVKIIEAAKGVPNCSVYVTRFGSLMNAYERVGFKPKPRYKYVATGAKIDNIICSAVKDIISDIEKNAGIATFLHELYLLTINGNLTSVVAVAWSVSDGTIGGKRARRWEVRKIKYKKSDLTLVIRMDTSNVNIQDYFLVPTVHLPLTKDRKKLRVSDRVFAAFRYDSFDATLQALHARLNSRTISRKEGATPSVIM